MKPVIEETKLTLLEEILPDGTTVWYYEAWYWILNLILDNAKWGSTGFKYYIWLDQTPAASDNEINRTHHFGIKKDKENDNDN